MIWSDENKVSKQLAVEVALAKIEGELGIIPKTAAQQIIEKAKEDILEKTNIETNNEEMKVLDNFLFRCWQMDWLDKYKN